MKPVIPFSFFDPVTKLDRPSLHGQLELNGGLAFGMVVRAGITKSISFETGIDQITRRYDLSLANDTTGYQATDQIRFVGYEVPALLMIYIRLGERSWMNNALGASIDLFPSDAERVQESSRVYLARTGWARLGVVGNVGVEYRTPHSGWIYLGATYHRPFGDLAVAEVTWYDRNALPYTMKAGIGGSYLTLDLRYFFHGDPQGRPRKRDRSPE